VGNSIFYPAPLHSIAVLNATADTPVTGQVCREVISIPVHPSLSEADLHTVADTVKAFYKG
jgi:dTDP-4-amino-4,6-dideoxygalactose transaminase